MSVDENGTRAAASTAVIGTTLSESILESMTVDRPFIFVIRDIPTDSILFVGRVLDP